MSDSLALREALAYEIKRWKPAKTFAEARVNADTVIAALELPTLGSFPVTHHPLVKWVADKFVVHWKEASAALTGVVQILMPDLILVVGVNGGGTRHGFRKNNYGSINPTELRNGDDIKELRLRLSNTNFHFIVDGFHEQDEFTSIEVNGVLLLSANVTSFDNSGTDTEWKWNATGIDLPLGATVAVDFL